MPVSRDKIEGLHYLIMISQGSLSWAIKLDPHFSVFGYHHASPSKRHFFDLLIQFSCGNGWLGLHTWWWMIWCHLIFWPTTYMMPYWGIFPFWLRFVDHHCFAWSFPFMRYTLSWWSVFILRWFLSEAFYWVIQSGLYSLMLSWFCDEVILSAYTPISSFQWSTCQVLYTSP